MLFSSKHAISVGVVLLLTPVTCCLALNVQLVCVAVLLTPITRPLALNAHGDWTGHCYIYYSTILCFWLHNEELKFEANDKTNKNFFCKNIDDGDCLVFRPTCDFGSVPLSSLVAKKRIQDIACAIWKDGEELFTAGVILLYQLSVTYLKHSISRQS